MKIYTKAGDKGMTSLTGGRRVPKWHGRITACGTADELLAFMGLLRDSVEDQDKKKVLLKIQDRLMTIASLLAAETEDLRKSLPALNEEDIEFLEKEIDLMSDKIVPLHSFILPGGHPLVSFCHITRTVCRRAERNAVKVTGKSDTDILILKYLNRLSDFIFTLSRLISSELQVKEIPWNPNL